MSRVVAAPIEPPAHALVAVVPEDLKSRDALFDVLAASLHFPYFGRNWDALLDLISDLHWVSVDEVWIVHPEVPSALGGVWQTYVDLLNDAVARRNSAVDRGFADIPALTVVLPPSELRAEDSGS